MNTALNPDALRGTSAQIKLLRSELEDNLNRIECTVIYTGADWMGSAARIHAAKIIYVKQGYGKLLSFLNDLSELLANTADAYSELDKTVANEIKNIECE